MLKRMIAAAGALLIAATAQAEVAPGKLVIYRADEATRTQRIKFHASVDNKGVGRLAYKKPVVIDVEPGTYKLGTSLGGTEALEVNVQPGRTYYVHASVRKLGQNIKPQLQVVEQQVAVSQKPAIEEFVQDPV